MQSIKRIPKVNRLAQLVVHTIKDVQADALCACKKGILSDTVIDQACIDSSARSQARHGQRLISDVKTSRYLFLAAGLRSAQPAPLARIYEFRDPYWYSKHIIKCESSIFASSDRRNVCVFTILQKNPIPPFRPLKGNAIAGLL